MTSPLIGVGLIALVAVGALLLRRSRGGDETIDARATDADTPGHEAGGLTRSAESTDVGGDAAPDPESRVLVTLEGVALVEWRGHVRQVPLAHGGEAPDWLRDGIEAGSIPWRLANPAYSASVAGPSARESGVGMNAGDFTAARVRHAEDGSWRLETLGRDGDFGFFPFHREETAHAALAMLEASRIVRDAIDADGDPIHYSVEDFEEARRLYEQTERELALSGDEDEPPRPNDYSDRR